MQHIWVRAEVSKFEKRVPLIPEHAELLVKNGYKISIEESSHRCIAISEYQKIGCQIVPENSWEQAPLDAYILGIKALANETFPLIHKHLYFAHVYKGQRGADKILDRFIRGGGVLLDMEYLIDFNKNQLVTRSAGYWAGICAAGAVLDIWIQKQNGKHDNYAIGTCYNNLSDLLNYLSDKLVNLNIPKILIIGAGMSGQGVAFLLDKLNLDYTQFTRKDTLNEPIKEILDFNILFNCIMVDKNTNLFLTQNLLNANQHLSLIGDVSCDPGHPRNPLPLYCKPTTFSNPTIKVGVEPHQVDIMAIDHITTLLPQETSYAMSEQIFPYLCQLLIIGENFKYTPWANTIAEFKQHTTKQE